MKNGKKLTVFQRQHLQSLGLEPNDWLLSKKTNMYYSCALETERCEEVVRCIMFSHHFNVLFLFISNIKK